LEEIIKPHPFFYVGMARPDREELIKAIDERENLPLFLSIPNSCDLEPAKILNLVASYFKLPPLSILENSRKGDVVKARQWAMFLMRSELGLTLSAIGKIFSYRKEVNGIFEDIRKDHATVLYSYKKITGWIQIYPEEAKIYEYFKNHI
tara:strand:+ start:2462 stop:2908 length:447 start_codon:yes stop_codon:yes gene_type:complete